jgi:hypothetical protein
VGVDLPADVPNSTEEKGDYVTNDVGKTITA